MNERKMNKLLFVYYRTDFLSGRLKDNFDTKLTTFTKIYFFSSTTSSMKNA